MNSTEHSKNSPNNPLIPQAEASVHASRQLALLSTEQKNQALLAIGEALLQNTDTILAANALDVQRARSNGQTVMVDRLILTPERIESIVQELRNVVQLEDPIGKEIDRAERPNGLKLQRVRVPLGVVGMIYESRPNVTVDATVLCLKSGNAIMLKGGSDAIDSNRAIVKVMKTALQETAIPSEAVQFLDTTDRAMTGEFLKLRGYLDVIIPRGGQGLINFVVENSAVPVIETGASVVHTYVDAEADLEKAATIVTNAKTRRVSICNSLDTVLVHADVVEPFMNKVVPLLQEHDVEIRCDERSLAAVSGLAHPDTILAIHSAPDANLTPPLSSAPNSNRAPSSNSNSTPTKKILSAQPDDFGKEFLDYILAVKTVDSLDEAMDHITQHSLKHSEAIVTENSETAERFLKTIDAACVYWNASTQFSDGAQFGLGAEIGISTQKLHVRGPFALEGLTTFKWIIRGNGQTRPS